MKVLDKLDSFLNDVEKPARYYGGELNMVVKDEKEVDVRFAFCFPDVYEIGMSYLGLNIIYKMLNERDDTYVERVFSPWPDMEAKMKENDVPLYSLETYSTIDEFDIMGFNISYEMCFSNIINALKLSNIEPLAADRKEEDPIIVAGGSAIYNPEPIADFMDVIFIGEGEDSLNSFVDIYKEKKEKGYDKKTFLKMVDKLDGIYVPSFYKPVYDEDEYRLEKIEVEAKDSIKKTIVEDFDKCFFPTNPIVPFLGVVHDRITLEIFRGCTRGCRFCQAGFTYRPIREKKSDTLVGQAKEIEKKTGYDEISLCSLSTSDYSEISQLIDGLNDEFEDKRVSVSLPSLRLDTVFEDYANKLDTVRKSGLTFAPEAGTQRMRDIINKNVTEEDLFRTMEQIFTRGYTTVKLYFMIGLPFETYEDLDGIVDLVKEIKSIYGIAGKNNRRKLTLTVSASNFIPKPFTPFQWVAQDDIEVLKEKQFYLKDKLKMKGVRFNYHDANLSFLEAVFARGDRSLSKVLLKASENGAKFDSWNEHFDIDNYMKVFSELGIDPNFYANRKYETHENLYWDHIDAGIKKEFLADELKKAENIELTPDCREGCLGCGLEEVCK